ncbi:DUF1707 domain-containing protein [Kitasatospora sp. NPDC048722]|uniref:DUF1707 SHOCT-like domain-containing protein n=1 Tax=Kitasatospora sp. NPDC048722 TaxID=3155639 RepID=UPI0033FE0417
MSSLPQEPSPLAGESDRDTAVQRLQEAYAEGHITHEEMDERLDRVLVARTRGDLAQALGSLPPEKPGTSATIGALSGRIVRRGPWRVPRTLRVESAFGRVHLDLSKAVIEHPVIDIVLGLGTGRAKITVPRDAVVDLDGLKSGWKDTVYRPPRNASGGGPTIRFTGAMGYGRLRIRHARR